MGSGDELTRLSDLHHTGQGDHDEDGRRRFSGQHRASGSTTKAWLCGSDREREDGGMGMEFKS